jgi:hypothetical protein
LLLLPACLPTLPLPFYAFDSSEFFTAFTMTKDTGVPKLKGNSNSRQWYTRLKTYMIAKETWPAVRFIPQKNANEETEGEEKSKDPAFAFDDENDNDDEFKYHPKNSEALHHILTHCEDGPANKIRGIRSARDAMITLMKLYGSSSEVEKYLVAEKLWTTTYASAETMEKYTEQLMDTWNEIQRRQITLDFLVRALAIFHLGEHFTSFQQRKREAGIEKLSFEELVGQLKQEELIANRDQTTPIIMLTKNSNTCAKCKKTGHTEKDCWKDITCEYCKKKGHPEDRCHKKSAKEEHKKEEDNSAPSYLCIEY